MKRRISLLILLMILTSMSACCSAGNSETGFSSEQIQTTTPAGISESVSTAESVENAAPVPPHK